MSAALKQRFQEGSIDEISFFGELHAIILRSSLNRIPSDLQHAPARAIEVYIGVNSICS